MFTRTVSISDAAANLADLVKQALQGDEVIIAEAEQALVRLVPVSVAGQPRQLGLHRDEVWMSDDFDDPLPDEFWDGAS